MNGDGGDIYSNSAAARKIRGVVKDIRLNGFSRTKPFSVGFVERRMFNYAKSKGIQLASKSMYMTPHAIAHSLRNFKAQKNKTVSTLDLASFPMKRRLMDLFYDGKAFVYTDYKNKYIIHPNYEVKINRNKVRKVNYITATRVMDANEFKGKRYEKI